MKTVSLQEILKKIGGRVVNAETLGTAVNLDTLGVERPAPLGKSQRSHLAFFFSKAFQEELASADPGILITGEPFVKPLESARLPLWKTAVVVACQDPYFAMAQLSERFAELHSSVAHVTRTRQTEIHPTAIIPPSVKLGEGVKVGAYCVVEEHASLGAGTVLYPHCYVGPRCEIGKDCVLFSGVRLYEWTVLGDRVRIHSGSVIGADGFGYVPQRDGNHIQGHQKIYHLGHVVIGSDVEIGANCCVDRGTFGETRIGKNAKLDNQVHLGHNSSLDEGAIVCGGTCLAGHASVGKYAYVGGLTGIVNHVHVGNGAKVGAMTLVTKDVPPGETVVGNPQRNHKEHFRAHALLSKLLNAPKGKN